MKNIILLFLLLPFISFSQERKLDVDFQDWKLYAPLSLLDSVQAFHKFGANDAISTGTAEDIWAAGGTFPLHTTADTLQVVSSEVTDSTTSTGCLTLVIQGIDLAGEYLSDTVTMTGTTTATTDVEFLYVNHAYCNTAGTNRTNAGNITITHKDDATTIAYILAGKSQAQQLIYAVPTNETLLLSSTYFSLDSPNSQPSTNPRGNVGLFLLDSYLVATSTWRELRVGSLNGDGSSSVSYEYEPYFKINGGSLIKARVTSSLETAQEFSGSFNGYLIKSNAVTENTRLKTLNKIGTFDF